MLAFVRAPAEATCKGKLQPTSDSEFLTKTCITKYHL